MRVHRNSNSWKVENGNSRVRRQDRIAVLVTLVVINLSVIDLLKMVYLTVFQTNCNSLV